MAEYVLAYPFSIDSNNNRANVVFSSTDTYKAQQIKAFLRTMSEERPMFPSFGIDEPTFYTFDTGVFYDAFVDFYAPDLIKINQIKLNEVDGALASVVVEFT